MVSLRGAEVRARRVRRVSRSAAASADGLHGIESGDDGREFGGDDLQDRGSHQELLQVFREVADDLLREVVVELLVGAGQAPDESAHLGRRPVAERRLDELERRRPALVWAVSRPGRRARVAPVRLGEEARGLGSVEPQVVGPDSATSPKPADGRTGWVASAGWRRRSTAAPGRE